MSHRRNDKSGFTLIELLVVIAILSIIMLSIYTIVSNMISASAVLEAKVKMREESRQALQHMTANLRMAGLNNVSDPTVMVIQYNDGNGLVDWPPPVDAALSDWSEPQDNISFVRPLPGNDGLPFVDDTSIEVNWSDVITFEVVTVDSQGRTVNPRLIQTRGGVFDKLLIDDVSEVVQNGPAGSPFNTSDVGGVSFRASTHDSSTIWISVITRRNLGPTLPTIPLRYDDWIDVLN